MEVPSATKGVPNVFSTLTVNLNDPKSLDYARKGLAQWFKALRNTNGPASPWSAKLLLNHSDGGVLGTGLLFIKASGVADVLELVTLVPLDECRFNLALDKLFYTYLVTDEGLKDVPVPQRGYLSYDACRIQSKIPQQVKLYAGNRYEPKGKVDVVRPLRRDTLTDGLEAELAIDEPA
jgi:hypothetical protein